MHHQKYKQRLLDLERHLADRMGRETQMGRAQSEHAVADSGDAAVANEGATEDFAEAELDSTVLIQVRDALSRIEAGTFGTCGVDGEPIEPNRLEASPWVPYCLKHQQLLEASSGRRFPTL